MDGLTFDHSCYTYASQTANRNGACGVFINAGADTGFFIQGL